MPACPETGAYLHSFLQYVIYIQMDLLATLSSGSNMQTEEPGGSTSARLAARDGDGDT
jgi:hypothetical protein